VVKRGQGTADSGQGETTKPVETKQGKRQ